MLTRRTFSGLALASTVLSPRNLFAQTSGDTDADVIPPLPAKYASMSKESPRNTEAITNDQQTGFGAADQHDVKLASQILNGAPSQTTPFAVAQYFHAIALGKSGVERQSFMRAWPRSAPANPLIRSLFLETSTVPSGDVTAWCAAFLNWCMVRAYSGRKDFARLYKPPRSASSGSFRKWGKKVALTPSHGWSTQPLAGDIVVFAKVGPSGKVHPTQGHVAFFEKQEGAYIRVLGGNQFEGRPPIHCINSKRLRIYTVEEAIALVNQKRESGNPGSVLAVHSVRTARSLHEALLK